MVLPYQTILCHNPQDHIVDLCYLEDLHFYSFIIITQLNSSVLCSSSQKCFSILTLYPQIKTLNLNVAEESVAVFVSLFCELE